jgi:predicted nucleic acid-binding protein
VPAIERGFDEMPPSRLYLDTDFVITYLVSTQRHHARCQAFVERLGEMGLTTIFVSPLVWLEFAHVITRESFRAALPPDLTDSLQVSRWQESLVRQTYIQAFLGLLEAFLAQFEIVEIPLATDVRVHALQNVALYGLDTHDAAHLATAISAGVLDLASFDGGFRRVDGLYLWNDHVHTP